MPRGRPRKDKVYIPPNCDDAEAVVEAHFARKEADLRKKIEALNAQLRLRGMEYGAVVVVRKRWRAELARQKEAALARVRVNCESGSDTPESIQTPPSPTSSPSC